MPNKTPKPDQALVHKNEYHVLNNVPPESEWLKDYQNRSKQTSRGYKFDLEEFKKFMGIEIPDDYRKITRKHVIEWIEHLISTNLTNSSINRKICAISSLFKFYCDRSAVNDNPCKNIKRPKLESDMGGSYPISDDEAAKLLNSPAKNTIRGLRDRAILAVFLFQGLRRAEVADLKVSSLVHIKGNPFIKVKGKGSKIRVLPLNATASDTIYEYLEATNRVKEMDDPLFCALKKYRDKNLMLKHMSGTAIYEIVMFYARAVGIKEESFHPHCLRSTAATKAREKGADLRSVQEFLGHKHVITTERYDKYIPNLADSPAFKIKY